MGSFNVQNMLGSKAVITGTDALGNSGSYVADTQQWDELKARTNFSSAVEDFDAAVEAFFKPLTEAAKAANEAKSVKQDPLEYVVLKEGTEAVAGEPDEIVELTTDSIILRLIEENQTDRLIWVNNESLGILAQA